MAHAQEGRFITLETSLGKDVLLLESFTGVEGVSRLFRFHLDLLSERGDIDGSDLIGRPVAVAVTQADGPPRYINGLVSRFGQAESDPRLTRYSMEIVPWLWLLTRTADCRIFQNISVPDIIESIFKEYGLKDYKLQLQGSFEPREYCVQYRETDFNFVSRLMEQYGIFYFFEHEATKHTLVLANSPSAHRPCPGIGKVRVEFTGGEIGEEDVVVEWHDEQELRSGKYSVADFNFETPTTSLLSTVAGTVTMGSNGKLELYDYPGEYQKKVEGEALAKLRIEEEEAEHWLAVGRGTCRGLVSGFRFDLDGHFRKELNTAYVVLEIQHAASTGSAYETGVAAANGAGPYTNSFVCMPHKVPYRPPRLTPKPVVQGVQTAIVVGPKGEEIYTDTYGRVKVQFHWDREGKYDEKSSCWVRVAEGWAGKRWGSVFTPRVGQEVIVDFLEGDPDQPIITGRVYNAAHMPPYELPGEHTKSTIKTYSSKGGGGFNEIRFEDRKGKEQVFLHAARQQDVRVKRDSLEWVGQDRHLIVVGEQREEVKKDKHLTVSGDQNEQVDGSVSLKAGMDLQKKIGMKRALDAGMEIHLKAGMNVVVEAGLSITVKAGGGFIVVGPTGVTISGMPILMNSGGAAGNGSGASPDPPKEPLEADKAEPGKKVKLPEPKVVSSQAIALRQAAKSGVPFCEKCAAAARAAALARGATPEEAEEAAQEAGRAGAEKTWIEIQLVDADGQPVANEPFRITLPDGSDRQGVTDAAGLARFDELDPGTCELTFHKRDRSEWRKT
jgi:type VI secretion system secreted protein VgrG